MPSIKSRHQRKPSRKYLAVARPYPLSCRSIATCHLQVSPRRLHGNLARGSQHRLQITRNPLDVNVVGEKGRSEAYNAEMEVDESAVRRSVPVGARQAGQRRLGEVSSRSNRRQQKGGPNAHHLPFASAIEEEGLDYRIEGPRKRRQQRSLLRHASAGR